ncbi:MAG TPA: GMP synthase [Oceanospirillaceae bacterium]|nr:GMP synthase [Oceanospirillaceae bacterium]
MESFFCYSVFLNSFGAEQLSRSTLTVGLLLCDTMHDYLQPEAGGDFDDIFNKHLSNADQSLTVKAYRTHQDELPNSPCDADLWLINGSPNSVYYDLPWIQNLIGLVQDIHAQQIPLVGICFGHQIIATALGGKVEKSDHGWGVGMARYPITQQASWMQPQLDNYGILVFHQDQVVKLPDNAQVLSGNDFCPYFWLQYDAKTMSTQGHPEFFKGFISQVLSSREFDELPEIRAQGLNNLDGEPDTEVMFQWIVNFFREAKAV